MVTSWPLTSRTALKWKKLTQFFYHEWLLDVVVEDWDIRPILLMHFLKWICKWISFQSYWVLSDTLQQHVWFHQKNILLWPKEQPLAARYVHHSLPRRSYYFRWVIEWPGTKVALLQHKPMCDRGQERKQSCHAPKSLTNALRKVPRRTKSVADSQLHAKKVKERRSWR